MIGSVDPLQRGIFNFLRRTNSREQELAVTISVPDLETRDLVGSEQLAAAIANFRNLGFAVLRNAVDLSTVEAIGGYLRSELSTAAARVASVLDMHGSASSNDAPIAFSEPDHIFSRLNADDASLVAGHFPLAVRLSATLHLIRRSEKLLNFVRTALECEDLRMHLPPAARFVLPHNRRAAVPAHQDITYNKHIHGKFLTAWLPFVHIDEKCGGVAVYPGSRKIELTPHPRTNGFWYAGVEPCAQVPIHYPLNPGDALLLDPFIVHESHPNSSTHARLSVDFRFFPAEVFSSKHFLEIDSGVVVPPA